MKYSIVETGKAAKLRSLFIEHFIDTEHEYYKTYIEKRRVYPDGMCYEGYLWDVLKNNRNYEKRCAMEEATAYLKTRETVYVMWDIYSVHRVRDGSWMGGNLPKGTVICVSGAELADVIGEEWDPNLVTPHLLPEDIYCFDESFRWFVVFTHEGDDWLPHPEPGEDDYIRICFLDRE